MNQSRENLAGVVTCYVREVGGVAGSTVSATHDSEIINPSGHELYMVLAMHS